MFFRVLSKIFSLYLFRLGEAVLVGVFKKVLFPQRVASEKVRNVRVPRNYFSLHLFPVGEAILGGVLKKVLFPQRADSEKPVFYLCFEYFFTCSHLERSKVVPASKFSSSRGRSREEPKIKPFENFFLSSIGRQRG